LPNESQGKLSDFFAVIDDDTLESTLENLQRDTATEAGVRELLDAGEALLDSAPPRAEAAYRTARVLVGRLASTPEQLALSLVAHAEKGRANALRMRGEYRAALAALVRAERDFRAASYCRRELGYARYCVATVLFKMERWDDAERVVRSARTLLEREHERAGVISCDVVSGCILLERGELDRARAIFVTQEKLVEARRDAETLARLTMNIAVCDLRRRDAPAAANGLAAARVMFRDLSLHAEIVRVRWCGAKLLLLQKRRASALRELRGAARDFMRLGMPLDAGFVQLGLVEELVAAARWAEAEPVARSVANLFLKAGVRPSASTALAFLRQTVENRTATREFVVKVAHHLRRSEVFPDEQFTFPSTPESADDHADSGGQS
jgi:tetratricopeptide (TPR) repeat protein